MYFIILVVYLLNWKRILNIISSIYFFIFRIDEKYILKNDNMKKMVGIENIYDIWRGGGS